MHGHTTFAKAVAVSKPPLDYLCTEAIVTPEGTFGDVMVVNGDPKWADRVCLTTEAGRADAAGRIQKVTACDTSTAEAALLELHIKVAAQLRGSTAGAKENGQQHAPPEPESEPARPAWPTLADEALYGLSGDIVQTIEPHTEADPAAVLINVLAAFGNAVGYTPHTIISGKRHGVNLYANLVGDSAKARKGTSLSYVRTLLDRVDVEWQRDHIVSGLSSAEGLIFTVRDPIKTPGKDGEPDKTVDAGVEDKRLLVIEEELASVLKRMEREGNTLSQVLRQAWDDGNLRTLIKNNPTRATSAHISVLGHITTIELQRVLSESEAANGFGNRFLWLCARRSKYLPDGGGAPDFHEIVPRLRQALEFARGCTAPIYRDADASAIWHAVYKDLSDGRPGMFGAVIARAEAQVVRLSMIYALLDCSPIVRADHLQAALALWQYCEDSARYIFGDRLGDAVADRILEAVREAGDDGLDRDYIYRTLFSANVKGARIQTALEALLANGLIAAKKAQGTGAGRPRTIYTAN